MFLLIPALLLAMEVAPFSSVTVRPPQFTAVGDQSAPPTRPEVSVRVTIRVESVQAELRRSEVPGPDVKSFTRVRSGDGTQAEDFGQLETFARAVKRDFPGHSRVELTAESEVTLDTLVAAMDALRGRDCSLPAAPVSDECLLWQVVRTS